MERYTGWNATNGPCDWKGISCNNGHITQSNFDYNQLSGHIPELIGNLKKLEKLRLESNQLSGPIPQLLVTIGLAFLFLF